MTDLVNPAGEELVINDGINDPANGHYGFSYPQTVTLSNGNILVVGAGSNVIVGNLYDSSGTLLTPDLLLSSTSTSFGQFDVVALNNGGFAISVTGSAGVLRLFDSAGQPTTGEIALDSSPATSVNDPSMALLDDGNVLISWLSSVGVLVGRVVDPSGATVDEYTLRPSNVIAPDVAALPGGGFVAVWADTSGVYGGGGGFNVIVGQKYAEDGTPVGSTFALGNSSAYSPGESDPSVTVLSDGTVAVAFRHGAVTSEWTTGVTEVVVRLVHPDGTMDPLIEVSNPVNVTIGNHNDHQEEFPQIIALPEGGFAVGFTSTDDYGGYGGRDYYVATFDSDGNRVTGNQLANAEPGAAAWGSLTALEDGSILTVWGNGGTQGRLFTATHLDGTTVDGDSTDNDLTGTGFNDVLNAYEGNDQLDGGAGADVMRGGDGDDQYVVDDSRDSVIEDRYDGGNDTITASADYRLAEGMYVENLVAAAGSDDVSLTGNGFDQALQGNDGDNVLDGGGGEDSFAGGGGDDTYIILGDRNYGLFHATNSVVENAGEGIDTVQVRIGSYTLAANVENLTGTESQAQSLTGNELDNIISGGNGDTLSGLGGNDLLIRSDGYATMAGGAGDDVYVILNPSDSVTENAEEGTDEVRVATGGYTLGANVENLTGTSDSGQALTGNGLGNVIESTGLGADSLYGMGGDDSLSGGAGNDNLDGGDGIDRASFAQSDSAVTVDLAAGTSTGDGTDTLTAIEDVSGSQYDDVINGDDGDNQLDGVDGDDTLRGAGGDDVLHGGNGNDFLVEASGDFGPFGNDVYDGGDGSDRVSLFTTYGPGVTVDLRVATAQDTGSQGVDTFIGIEHITANYGDDTLTGNDDANWFWTFSGHDVVSGNGGDDYFTVGSGDKVADGGSGTDTIEIAEFAFTPVYTSAGITVSLALQGTAQDSGAGIWTISNMENLGGFNGDDELTGDGNANVLAGQLGNDVLEGGGGDDTLAGEGTFAFEDGAQHFHEIDTLDGPGGNDTLRGGDGNDHLIGGGGDDFLSEAQAFGPWGDDIYDGGDGNDRVSFFTSANQGVTVDLRLDGIEQDTGLGSDTLISVEHVTAGYGNDSLTGNDAGNWFWTFSGTDTMSGNGGDDYFTVGLGTKVIDGGSGNDTVEIIDLDFAPAYTAAGVAVSLLIQGKAQQSGVGSFTLTSIENLSGYYGADRFTGNGAANTLAGEGGDDVLVGNGGDDTLAGDGSFGLSGADAGAITFIEEAAGAAGDDMLEGGLGNDRLIGGAGADTASYAHADAAVTVNLASGRSSGADGNDLLSGIENVVGSAFGDALTGDEGANLLDGRGGADVMRGALGDDTYIVDDLEDQATEGSNAGIDTVKASVAFTLGGNVENLQLTGSEAINGKGNSLDNDITGNSAANQLDGGAGADTLKGGGGDDVYVVDNAADRVSEGSSAGIDLVKSSVTYALTGNVENLTLIGSNAINGKGNSLANTLTGNAAANQLDGAAGADTMKGGGGNDTYTVDSSGDHVIEGSGAGTDKVNASVSFTLGSNLENLVLSGSGTIAGRGNSVANQVTGNAANNSLFGFDGDDNLNGGAGNDQIYGGLGIDKLTGGSGTDRFVFDSALGTGNHDNITDYSVADDTIVLDQRVFTAFGVTGKLAASAFFIGTAAHDADDRVVYNSGNGNIYYDADGNGAGAQVLIAHVSAGLALTNADFLIVA